MQKELTPEQLAKIPEYRQKWTAIGLNCDPAARAEAENYYRQAYDSIKMPHPRYIAWGNSPLMGAFMAGVFADPDKGAYTWINGVSPDDLHKAANDTSIDVLDWAADLDDRGELKPGLPVNIRNAFKSLWTQLCYGAIAKKESASGQLDTDNLSLAYTCDILVALGLDITQLQRLGELMFRDKLAKRLEEVESNGRQKAWDACYGSHDASWLGFYEFFRDEVGYEKCNELNGLIGAAKTSGWFWPFEHICIGTERHTQIHLDERERLSSLNSPAVQYRDGFEIFAVNGVQMPDWLIKGTRPIAADDILNERNQEVRRIMLGNFYAREKFLRDIDAKCIAEDEFGKLWRGTRGDLTVSAVEVVNGSIERVGPDAGKRRTYFLGCLNTHSTPKEAVAWTYNLRTEEYAPVLRT